MIYLKESGLYLHKNKNVLINFDGAVSAITIYIQN